MRSGRAARWWSAALIAASVTLTGCAGGLAPKGPSAGRISDIFWVMMVFAGIVFVIVMGALVIALRRPADDGDEAIERHLERRFVIGGGVILPAVVLGILMVLNVRTIVAEPTSGDMTIDVVGYRYWWEATYDGFTTANEIHIPTGTKVALHLTSVDVVHSVWIPELAGKADMVPGREQTLVIEADEPGRYVGRCAEFCGLQHAWMLFTIVAEEPADFAAWRDNEAAPAPEPEDPQLARGREVYLTNSCVGCHAIRGVDDRGELGPDLTHLANREKLGAGIIDNTDDELTAWIANPQAIKPGVAMPPQSLSEEDLSDVVAYLGSLK